MNTVRDLLAAKGNRLWTVPPTTTVFRALEIMAEQNIGSLVVVDQDRILGIFSERDYARKIILQGKSSKTTTVGEMMTADIRFVTPESTIAECMAVMTEKRQRHLPVIDSGQLVGLISIGDVVKAVIHEQESTIRTLETYITGGHTST
jgi:CBS domain-containing protein